MPESDVTLGELGRRLDGIAQEISSFRTEAVLRGEYEAHRLAIDREIRDIKGELARRDEAAAAAVAADTSTRPSWPQIASALAAVGSLLLTVLLLIFVTQSQQAPL